jgi:hypothetical protein
MNSTLRGVAAGFAIAAALGTFDAAAAPPKTLNYQGFLTSASDTPIDAPVQITFKLYTVPTGGVALWSETQPSVTVAKGEFSTVLGNATPLTLAFDVPYYLGVSVGADPEMTPRQPLATSAYAFRALALDSAVTLPGSVLTGSIPVATLPGTQITGSISTATIPGSHVTGDLSGVGNIDLPSSTASTGNLVKNGTVFLHDFGSGNVFLGEPSGNFTMIGFDNTGIGDNTLTAVTTGSINTAVGLQALQHNTTGSVNTAVGVNALLSNTTADGNSAVGEAALAANTTGASNTAVGYSALSSNTTAGFNTAVGANALLAQSFNPGTGPWSSSNTAVGYNALASNQPTTTFNGAGNTAVGAFALNSNTIGDSNTAIGLSAMRFNTTGAANTAIGTSALVSNHSGSFNIAIGADALLAADASFNIAIGNGALNQNLVADNLAIGANALSSNSTGTQNLAVGENALSTNVAGSNNTAVGQGALVNASGSGNIALGRSAGVNLFNNSNNIDIGNQGVGTDNGVIRIGTAGTQTTAFIAGVRGVTTVGGAIPVLVDTTGQLGTTSSSRTVKEDIEDMGEASSMLAKLRPVAFRYKERPGWSRQYGLIAEEVAEVAPELAARSSDGSIETVYYQFLAPMLLNEYQKQLRINAEQRARIDAEHARVEALEHRLSILESKLGGTQ